MKKWMVFVLVAAVALPAAAQWPPEGDGHNSLPEYRFEVPDSLSRMTSWRPSYELPARSALMQPAVSMTSAILLPANRMPSRFDFPENKVYRTPHVWISNGQAWNWGSYPDAYLDARTLSFPMPR